jgi:hypothetical protein
MKRKTKGRGSNRQKTRLGLPDLEHAKAAVLDSLRSPESQRSYRRSIEDFVFGIAPSLDFLSIRLLSLVIGFISKTNSSPPEPSMSDWQRSDDLPTKRRIPDS